MNKKLVFRVLGALSSALIIASMFIPFISVEGYSVSLWEQNSTLNSLYIPIMIIVFGAIGVITFALGVKTELAYMSTGAVTFYIVMQLLNVLGNNTFNTLGIAFYTLVIGTFLTWLMAFLTNLKKKSSKEEIVVSETTEEESALSQIDKLYNEQATPEVEPIQPVDSVVTPIQPLPVENKEEVVSHEEMPSVTDDLTANEPLMVNPLVNEAPRPNPVVDEFRMPVKPQAVQPETPRPNPVVDEFRMPVEPQAVQPEAPRPNPVVDEFKMPVEPQEAPQSESLFSFGTKSPVETAIPETGMPTAPQEETPVNPVVQDFTNPGSSIFANANSNNNETDIFGQPINR